MALDVAEMRMRFERSARRWPSEVVAESSVRDDLPLLTKMPGKITELIDNLVYFRVLVVRVSGLRFS